MSAVTPLSKEQVTPRFKRLDWLHWPLLMVVLLQGFYLWFNPYIYQSWQNGHLVRISRFTGEAERLTIYGWRTLEKRDDRARTLKPPLDLPSVSRYFPPAVDKTYVVTFRSHNDDRPSKFIVVADNMKNWVFQLKFTNIPPSLRQRRCAT